MDRVSSRRWVFTINNYTEEDIQKLQSSLTLDNCYFAVVGKEIAPTTKTPHLQGYAALKKNKKTKRIKGIKKIVGATAQVEIAKGSDLQNDHYCGKEEQVILRVGTPGLAPPGKK